MLDIVKKFFNKELKQDYAEENAASGHDLRIATCALLVEIAKIDNEFTNE